MDNDSQSSSLGQFPSKPSRRAVDAARLRRAASDRVKPGRGGLYSDAAWRQKSAIGRAAMPSLDRGTYSAVEGGLGQVGEMIFYPDGVEVVYPVGHGADGAQRGGGIRGRCRGRSRKSRRRMMRMMARLRPAGQVYFVGLNYPDAAWRGMVGDYEAMAAKFSRDLEVFFKRVERIFPDGSAMWGRDWQERKSGEFVGALTPHGHLIMFGLDPRVLDYAPDVKREAKDYEKSVAALVVQAWVKQIWYEIVGADDVRHSWRGADVVELDSRRKAFTYVSKYVAKVDAGVDADGEVMFTGRTWGYWNRDKLPLHPGIRVPITECEDVQFRRIAKRMLKGRGKSAERYGRWLARQKLGTSYTVFGVGLDALGGAAGDMRGGDDELALERIYSLAQLIYDNAVASRPR